MIKEVGKPIRKANRKMEHPVEALKALPEDAFRAVAVRLEFDPGLFFQLPPPLITQGEGHGQHSHEPADAASLGHVSILELIAAPLQMAEERLDAPSHPIDFERVGPLEIMTDDRQVGVAAFADALGGEVDLPAEHLMQIACKALPAVALAPPGGGMIADHGIGLHPDYEGDFHQLEPREPAAADKLPVHRQRADVRARQNGKHLLHERDAVAAAGVAALGNLGQNAPGDGQSDSVENHTHYQNVDVGSAELPVGAVHGQHPAGGGFGGEGEHECSDTPRRKRAGGEKPLETPVNRLGLCGGVRVAGEPDERDGALSNDRENQHQKAVQAGFGQPKVWLEMFAEGLHSGFGGSGIVFLVSHNQRLTPWAAIC